jgi:protein-S-isoprenylcysteine O-methyltransferase Ste14
MKLPLIKAIIILPGTALIFVPGLIMWFSGEAETHFTPLNPADLRLWIALVPLALGLALAMWTVRLFMHIGLGTPAPWDPPKKLVVHGPYRHVRNPMITSVLFILGAESLWFGSWPIAGWMLVFFVANAVYFPLKEEPDLEQRFGADYRLYKANVPRWIPRLRPWDMP